MKANLSRMLRSGVALLLAFCMIAGFVPTVAFAAETEETINYVSIGDSMTNGYGFVGYNQDEHTSGYDFLSGNGVYGENAYPDQFADKLAELNPGYTVDHTKLALSALRVENLRYLLGITDSEPVDGYTAYKGYAGENFAGDLRNIYQTAMKEADVVSLALGNASFNAFFFDRVMKVFGTIDDWGEGEACPTLEDALAMVEDEDQKQVIRQVYNLLKNKLTASVPSEMAAQFELEELCDLVAYTTASFLLSYEDVIDWIGENNDDAEVILVGVINSTSGLTIVGDGWEFDLGSAMDAVYGTVNAYLAALPTVKQMNGECENVKFYYAAQPSNPEMISAKIPALAAGKWTVVDGINGELVRNKTDSAYNSIVVGLANEAGLPLVKIDDDAVKVIENANETDTVSSLVTAAVQAGTINNNENEIKAYGAKLTSAIVYLGLEKAIVESMESSAISLEALATFAGDGLGAVLNGAPTDKLSESVSKGVTAFASFFCEEGMLDLVRLFAISKVGDGISAHPTLATHYGIAASVIAAYGNHTVQDETKENVKIALNELYNLLETYGPEAAAQVWAQWEEYGYVEAVETSVDQLKTMLETRYTYYTETALPAITASVENLSAQKDALTIELAALKAELEAKQAELADVVNNTEIGDIHVPDISIDVELGSNAQTNIPENDCTVDGEDIKTELEAAVRDLEHAIATIEALIADIDADIADLVALAEQIAAAVAELEKTMADVAAAAEDLEKAVSKVISIVKNSDGVVEQIVNSFEAARDTAKAAVEVLTLTIGTAEEMMADVDTMIEKIATDAEALYNKFMTELPGCIDQIPEEAKLLIAGSVYAAQQAYEANKDEIEAALTAELAKLEQEYEANKAAAETELAAIEAQITEEVNAKYAELEAEYNAQIEAAKTEAAAKLAELEAELKGYQTELEALAADAAEDVRAGLQAQIDRVNANIATVNADLEHAVGHLENAAQEAYEQTVAEVTRVYEQTIAALEKKLAELKQAYDKAVEDLTAEAEKAVDALTEALNKQLEALEKIGEDLADQVNGILTAIREELAAAQKAVEEILKGNLAVIEELKNALVEMGGEAIVDAVEALNDAVMALIEEATTADLVIDDDFKYVAIGDGSAAPESYVEKLTAALNAEAAENGVDEIEVVNYAKAGNTVAAERENLSDVADADLITVGFSNVEFLSKAIANAGSGAEMDWAAVVGEENVQYVDQLLDEVTAKIAEAGIEGENAVMANAAVEAYAYAAALYATELPELVNDIHAANAEALIIIVGMYNPMKGVTIALDANTTLVIDEYVDYLVKGVGVHGVAYSILSGNSIYVDAPAVQTGNADTELGVMDLLNLIVTEYASLYPSAVGDDYIAAEIADALNITYVKSEPAGLLGDADGNGVVNIRDAMLVAQYANKQIGADKLNLDVCDVDGVGNVNIRDAMQIAQYANKQIAKFPIQ